jgi:hypothetical protein
MLTLQLQLFKLLGLLLLLKLQLECLVAPPCCLDADSRSVLPLKLLLLKFLCMLLLD